jgi:hypothetical protein
MREKVSLELKAEAYRPSPQLKIAPKKRYHLHISYKSCTFAAQTKVCRHINIALLLFRVQEKSLRN